MRKTDVVGFSVPPELNKKFQEILKSSHKTKSEFFRELVNGYFDKQESANTDLSEILSLYWKLKSKQESQTIVIALGLIERDGKILIGSRKHSDDIVKNLSWVFPGGKVGSLDFSQELKKIIFEETGLAVSVGSLVASRIHPDSFVDNIQIVALYFHCTVSENSFETEKAGGSLSSLQWVSPMDVFKYFTTSVTDDVVKFLSNVSNK